MKSKRFDSSKNQNRGDMGDNGGDSASDKKQGALDQEEQSLAELHFIKRGLPESREIGESEPPMMQETQIKEYLENYERLENQKNKLARAGQLTSYSQNFVNVNQESCFALRKAEGGDGAPVPTDLILQAQRKRASRVDSAKVPRLTPTKQNSMNQLIMPLSHRHISKVSVTATRVASGPSRASRGKGANNKFTNIVIVPNVANVKLGGDYQETGGSLDSNQIQIKAKGFDFDNSKASRGSRIEYLCCGGFAGHGLPASQSRSRDSNKKGKISQYNPALLEDGPGSYKQPPSSREAPGLASASRSRSGGRSPARVMSFKDIRKPNKPFEKVADGGTSRKTVQKTGKASSYCVISGTVEESTQKPCLSTGSVNILSANLASKVMADRVSVSPREAQIVNPALCDPQDQVQIQPDKFLTFYDIGNPYISAKDENATFVLPDQIITRQTTDYLPDGPPKDQHSDEQEVQTRFGNTEDQTDKDYLRPQKPVRIDMQSQGSGINNRDFKAKASKYYDSELIERRERIQSRPCAVLSFKGCPSPQPLKLTQFRMQPFGRVGSQLFSPLSVKQYEFKDAMKQLSNNTSNKLLARNLQNSRNLNIGKQEQVAKLTNENENMQREFVGKRPGSRNAKYISRNVKTFGNLLSAGSILSGSVVLEQKEKNGNQQIGQQSASALNKQVAGVTVSDIEVIPDYEIHPHLTFHPINESFTENCDEYAPKKVQTTKNVNYVNRSKMSQSFDNFEDMLLSDPKLLFRKKQRLRALQELQKQQNRGNTQKAGDRFKAGQISKIFKKKDQVKQVGRRQEGEEVLYIGGHKENYRNEISGNRQSVPRQTQRSEQSSLLTSQEPAKYSSLYRLRRRSEDQDTNTFNTPYQNPESPARKWLSPRFQNEGNEKMVREQPSQDFRGYINSQLKPRQLAKNLKANTCSQQPPARPPQYRSTPSPDFRQSPNLDLVNANQANQTSFAPLESTGPKIEGEQKSQYQYQDLQKGLAKRKASQGSPGVSADQARAEAADENVDSLYLKEARQLDTHTQQHPSRMTPSLPNTGRSPATVATVDGSPKPRAQERRSSQGSQELSKMQEMHVNLAVQTQTPSRVILAKEVEPKVNNEAAANNPRPAAQNQVHQKQQRLKKLISTQQTYVSKQHMRQQLRREHIKSHQHLLKARKLSLSILIPNNQIRKEQPQNRIFEYQSRLLSPQFGGRDQFNLKRHMNAKGQRKSETFSKTGYNGGPSTRSDADVENEQQPTPPDIIMQMKNFDPKFAGKIEIKVKKKDLFRDFPFGDPVLDFEKQQIKIKRVSESRGQEHRKQEAFDHRHFLFQPTVLSVKRDSTQIPSRCGNGRQQSRLKKVRSRQGQEQSPVGNIGSMEYVVRGTSSGFQRLKDGPILVRPGPLSMGDEAAFEKVLMIQRGGQQLSPQLSSQELILGYEDGVQWQASPFSVPVIAEGGHQGAGPGRGRVPHDTGGQEDTPKLGVADTHDLRPGGMTDVANQMNLGDGDLYTEARSSVTLQRGRSSMKLMNTAQASAVMQQYGERQQPGAADPSRHHSAAASPNLKPVFRKEDEEEGRQTPQKQIFDKVFDKRLQQYHENSKAGYNAAHIHFAR